MAAYIHNVRVMWSKAAGVTELPQKTSQPAAPGSFEGCRDIPLETPGAKYPFKFIWKRRPA
jgi:hypothetical protein